MKPSETTIELSKELWNLGVRKEVRRGDWFIDDFGRINLNNYALLSIGDVEKLKYIPIWADANITECIEWLRGKGWKVFNGASGGGKFLVKIAKIADKQVFRKRGEAPTLIEALLKAMVKISNKKEVIKI